LAKYADKTVFCNLNPRVENLASLRIQVESLQEDLQHTPHSRIVSRLLGDSARLELQLENALFLAGVDNSDQLHIENLSLQELLNGLKEQWSEIQIQGSFPIKVKADVRALEGVLKNLVQNSRVHGKATEIKISVEAKDNAVVISINDNGRGFDGEVGSLGKLFVRPTSSSGSGVGLYLAKTLMEKMHGQLQFTSRKGQGFTAQLTLQGVKV
jgi:signal transduction histidine kinase